MTLLKTASKKIESNKRTIAFVCSARDYHAVDWYRLVKALCPNRRVLIITDLIESEGVERLVDCRDEVLQLLNLDRWLFKNQSRLGNIWRNFVKMLSAPLAAWRLYLLCKNIDAIFHAHSMYYIFICWLARVQYVATPMGSDVLVRPENSRIYKLLTIISLRGACEITVDSIALQEKIFSLCGRQSFLIQNGVNAQETAFYRASVKKRSRAISIRGMDTNYRLHKIIEARDSSSVFQPIDFIYPFLDESYATSVVGSLSDLDCDLGRLPKIEMYKMLEEAFVVFSIPVSDSSPRSVYESIFCGACVVATHGGWVDSLPGCMRARVLVVDIELDNWFTKAVCEARAVSLSPFVPSKQAFEVFDEKEAMKRACGLLYQEASYD
jgi:hypothetical protein